MGELRVVIKFRGVSFFRVLFHFYEQILGPFLSGKRGGGGDTERQRERERERERER
jgi:hypothetical protein